MLSVLTALLLAGAEPSSYMVSGAELYDGRDGRPAAHLVIVWPHGVPVVDGMVAAFTQTLLTLSLTLTPICANPNPNPTPTLYSPNLDPSPTPGPNPNPHPLAEP